MTLSSNWSSVRVGQREESYLHWMRLEVWGRQETAGGARHCVRDEGGDKQEQICRGLAYHIIELKMYQQLLNGIKIFTEITPYFGFCLLLLMSEISKYTTYSCRLLINH